MAILPFFSFSSIAARRRLAKEKRSDGGSPFHSSFSAARLGAFFPFEVVPKGQIWPHCKSLQAAAHSTLLSSSLSSFSLFFLRPRLPSFRIQGFSRSRPRSRPTYFRFIFFIYSIHPFSVCCKPEIYSASDNTGCCNQDGKKANVVALCLSTIFLFLPRLVSLFVASMNNVPRFRRFFTHLPEVRERLSVHIVCEHCISAPFPFFLLSASLKKGDLTAHLAVRPPRSGEKEEARVCVCVCLREGSDA